jgi:hypothetical protein
VSSPRFRLVEDVRTQIDTLHPAAFSVGPDGDLWLIAYDRPPPDPQAANPEWAGPRELTVLNFRDGLLTSAVTVRDTPGERRFVQPLGADEVLLVGAATISRPNARVVDTRGATVREFTLGNGIADVQATKSGEIWVSYYDDGTLIGSWKMTTSSHLSAMGDGSNNEHSGLLRATKEGTVSWRFTATARIEPIFWCDGLNVFGDGSAVWTCYSLPPWSELERAAKGTCPIVRIDSDGARRVWRLKGDARRALAVNDETILVGGGYGGDASPFELGRLGEGVILEHVRSIGGIPSEAAARVHVIGRGPVMHMIRDTRWYVMDLRG